MIRVEKDAQKTDAYQKDDNLLLSENARADSIPGLEIEANDVRCTHGATAGRVDEAMIFYLQSRGIDRETAVRLVVEGFFANVYDRIAVEPVRETLPRGGRRQARPLKSQQGDRPSCLNTSIPKRSSRPTGSRSTRTTPKVRIVESDEDPALYFQGHVPGAVEIGWHLHLQDQLVRDYVDVHRFEAICSQAGIANDTTVVFYGDKSNWWACYALWAFKLFGHKDCRILNGGYKLWHDQGRPMDTVVPKYTPTQYKVEKVDEAAIRAFRDDVLVHMKAGLPMIDVRSPKEFTGEKLHMEDYPQEGALTEAATSLGAKNVPWARARGRGRDVQIRRRPQGALRDRDRPQADR